MVYKNKNGQPRERAMVAAHSLVRDFGAPQHAVAAALGCSTSTVNNWVKEVGFRREISGLRNELADAQGYIGELRNELQGQLQVTYNPR